MFADFGDQFDAGFHFLAADGGDLVIDLQAGLFGSGAGDHLHDLGSAGVLIGEAPNLWLAKDTDGDLKADTKDLVRNDYGRLEGNPEHNANSLYWALDNTIYTSEHTYHLKLKQGKFEVIPLPMPEPIVFDGQRLPASYANIYIANGLVLVPTFNDVNDRTALGLLAELFPDREVVGIHCGDLVYGLGTLHCMTQQEPA